MKRQRRMAPTFHTKRDVEWILSDWFCPSCGKRDMWQEAGSGGDYYHDCEVKCFSCHHRMCCVDEVRDEPEKEAPWWDEESARNILHPKD